MKKNIFLFMSLFICLFVYSPLTSMGQELPPGMMIGDDQGLNATSKGEYYVNVKDVIPGKKWHTTISMVNMEKDIPYQLSMSISQAEVSGSLDLSEAIQMTLTYEGKIIYNGPASGVSKDLNLQKTRLDLGTFKAGDSRAIEVDYQISGDYTKKDFVKKNIFNNVWNFYAIKTKKALPGKNSNTTNPMKGLLPQTGEEWRQAMLFACVGLLLMMILLFAWKHRKEERK